MIEDRKRKLIDALIEICRSFLHTTNNTSEEAIHEAVEFNSKNPFFRELVQEDLERAELEIQDLEGIDMDIGASLNAIDDQFEEWLTTDRKQKLDHGYWFNYKNLLSKKNLSLDVITKIGLDTEMVISKCGDPLKNSNWERKGLVIGDVQSGKTANYIGLITKAADLGYKVIIVIAGRDNTLRRQTQQRIDDGFVNPKYDALQDIPRPFSVTNLEFDFDTPALQRIAFKLEKNLNPVVAVI